MKLIQGDCLEKDEKYFKIAEKRINSAFTSSNENENKIKNLPKGLNTIKY